MNLNVARSTLCWASLSRSLGLLSQDFLFDIVEESLGILPGAEYILTDLKGVVSIFIRGKAH